MAVDFKMLPESSRTIIDRLFIECQPGHIQHAAGEGIEPNARDISRADKVRSELSVFSSPDFDIIEES